MPRSGNTRAILLLCASVAGVYFPQAAAQTYRAIGEYEVLGSSARGIAVDSISRRIFIATGDSIAVLNTDTGAALGSIPLKDSQDVLLIPDFNGDKPGASTKGFATADGEVVSFSASEMKITGRVKFPASGASSLCYDPDAKTVEAVSPTGSLASLDAGTGKLLRSALIATGSGQITCGTLDHVYVADTAADVVHVLNHRTGKNDGDFPMMTGRKPSGLSLDTKGRRLFVACENGVIEVIDTDAGFTFIELDGAKGPAREIFAWTPQGKGQWKAAAFIAQRDGKLTAVRMNAFINYSIGGKYSLGPSLHSIAYDQKSHRLFITAMRSGRPVVVVVGSQPQERN